MENKIRLDAYLVQKGIVENRSRAQQLIRGKHVKIDNEVCTKTGKLVAPISKISVDNILRYVSRGGNKLEYAIEKFCIDVKGKVAADFGASTGGFTDCLIQKGAQKVYAIDIGKGQLHKRLQENPKICYIEGKDVRYLFELPDGAKVDLVVIDISMHPLESILSAVQNILKKDGEVVALIKPQFEIQKQVVSDKNERKKALYKVARDVEKFNLYAADLIRSPLKGGLKNQGNIEYLVYLVQKPQKFDVYKTIEKLIDEER